MIGRLLADPRAVGEVAAALIEPQHFFVPAYRELFGAILSAYYGDEPLDALSIATKCSRPLSRLWGCTEQEAVQNVGELARARQADREKVTAHAHVVKRLSDDRELLKLANSICERVREGKETPEQIAGMASQTAMQIATSTLLTTELHSFEDLGRMFVQQQRVLMEARKQGIEIGVYFGLSFIDRFMRGLRPTELWFLAGEPGAGKSAVAWKAAQLFAERQMAKPPERRIATLILSLEMGDEPSNVRLAQTITGLDGGLLREGRTTEADLRKVIDAWGAKKKLPLYFNFTSQMRLSQLRALVVEAIRKHNVGLVVIDHFKYVSSDRRFNNTIDEDEEKARFLKESIAKDLNVAVICLAHTTKAIESRDDARPKLSHLRGSGQVAAHADFVSFVYRPFNHASEEDKDTGAVDRTAAELIWAKNRHGLDGSATFRFDPSRMEVK